ncbi:MAG: Asp23/Gls24 family envelope stress response protein [Clostridiales bacterium]|jgi:uncharacterized alkaline shock family protein YloU|nr:Asp23/Gls24 family envelope stress response protein [Clostridiales bacterium]
MIKLREDEKGQLQVSEEVIAIIANNAALEIQGVVNNNYNLAKRLWGKKKILKDIKIDFSGEEKINIFMNISIDFGYKIPEVMQEVQKNVKISIENMTGLTVEQIDLNITGINLTKKESK